MTLGSLLFALLLNTCLAVLIGIASIDTDKIEEGNERKVAAISFVTGLVLGVLVETGVATMVAGWITSVLSIKLW